MRPMWGFEKLILWLVAMWFVFIIVCSLLSKYAHASHDDEEAARAFASRERFSWVQPFDDKAQDLLKWEDDQLAADISDMSMYVMSAAPVLMALDENNVGKRLLAIGAAHGVVVGLTQIAKENADRQRPNGNGTKSFFSGHTSAAFTSAGLICQSDKDVCGLAVAGASLTGYLRIAGNRHWATDVLTGAAVGFIVGKQVPILFMPF